MGCGCKNKGNESQPPAQSNVQQAPPPAKPNVNEDVKSAIKKTILSF